jgi:Polypeptide deformylase
MLLHFFARLLITLLLSFTAVAHAEQTNNTSTLTSAEWAALQSRERLQNTDVITTGVAGQQQLLKSASRPIDAKAPHLDVLVEQMRKAMLAHEGTGLTAVQIGIPVRVVLMQRTINGSRLFHSFINPEIVRTSPSKC